MKKKTLVLGMAVLLAALLGLSGVAQSAMWVGAELGGNFASSSLSINGRGVGNPTIDPAVIGGATIGYDFVNAGFGAYAWPDWMKYFSFAMDLTYNKLQIDSTTSAARGMLGVLPTGSRLNGYAIAWTFLFMAHYGFLPDSEVPSGRINPYIGVGPAIVFSGADFTVSAVNPTLTTNSHFNTQSTNVALVVEPGIRWVCLKNVSVDTAFRWRYMVPSWSSGGVTLDNTLNQFSFLVRANYHF